MKVLRDDPAPPDDLKAIDGVRPVVSRLTPAGRRKLLALVARQCLEDAEWTEVPLFNDEGRPFSYVMSLPRPEDEVDGEITPAVAAEILRRALTPEDSMTVEEFLARFDSEHGCTPEAEGSASPPARAAER